MPTSPSSFSTTAHRVVEPSALVGLEARMWLISDDLPAPRKPTTSVVGIFSASGRGIALCFELGRRGKLSQFPEKKADFVSGGFVFLPHFFRSLFLAFFFFFRLFSSLLSQSRWALPLLLAEEEEAAADEELVVVEVEEVEEEDRHPSPDAAADEAAAAVALVRSLSRAAAAATSARLLSPPART